MSVIGTADSGFSGYLPHDFMSIVNLGYEDRIIACIGFESVFLHCLGGKNLVP